MVKKKKKKIAEINPGRLIQTTKICPHLNQVCIKDRCNAFEPHFNIRTVTLEEKIENENIHNDLVNNGWYLETSTSSSIGPDNQDSLYSRQEQSTWARCLV